MVQKKKLTARKITAKKKPVARKESIIKKRVTTKKKFGDKKMTQSRTGWLVKLSQIVPSKNWNRDELGDISDLVASLQATGTQLQPVVVQATDDPKIFELVAGNRRVAAMRQLGWSTAKCVLIEESSKKKQQVLLSLAENLARRGNTPYEIARAFAKQVDETGHTNEQIAAACGKSPGFVSQHLAVIRAPAALQDALKKGDIVISLFRHFTKISAEEDKIFYSKVVDAALQGVSATKIGDRVTLYLQKKQEGVEKEARKTDGSPPPKKKPKGGAAHRRNGPQIEIKDYSDSSVRQSISMVGKDRALDALTIAANKLQTATTKDRKTYYMGVIDGMESLAGLVEVEEH